MASSPSPVAPPCGARAARARARRRRRHRGRCRGPLLVPYEFVDDPCPEHGVQMYSGTQQPCRLAVCVPSLQFRHWDRPVCLPQPRPALLSSPALPYRTVRHDDSESYSPCTPAYSEKARTFMRTFCTHASAPPGALPGRGRCHAQVAQVSRVRQIRPRPRTASRSSSSSLTEASIRARENSLMSRPWTISYWPSLVVTGKEEMIPSGTP